MNYSPKDHHRHRRAGTTPGIPIDLLVVAEDASDSSGKPNLARGLSIKLSPPETGEDTTVADSPAFYQSMSMASVASFESERRGSGVLDTDIPIPSQENRLADISDAAKTLGTALPLHRTESRLPSLEDMLNDEKLRSSLYEDARSVILDELTAALTKKDSKDKFKKLSELARRASTDSTFNLTRLTSKQKQAVIDNAVLFVKQQLSRSVEFWRAMIDAREGGLCEADFEHRVAHPDFEFGARPWSFISIGLKLLRNFCVNSEIQQLIEQHNLADSILLRHRLLYSAVSSSLKELQNASTPLRPYYEEVANVLPRSVFTFLSNLMAKNDDLRMKLWPMMWPNVYWSFLILAGDRFFDNFCLLLHNHLTPLLGSQTTDSDSVVDLDVSSSSPAMRQLKSDLQLLCATEEELAVRRANGDEDIEDMGEEFLNFLMAMLSIVWRRHRKQAKSGGHHKGRLASVQGRATQASAVAEDWFALLLLRLLSQGKGHALKFLIQSVLKSGRNATPSTGGDSEWLRVTGVPTEVARYIRACGNHSSTPFTEGTVTSIDLAGILIYAAAEYASVPGEKKSLQSHNDESDDKKEAVKQQTEQKLGRRWNLIRRSFLTTSIVNYMSVLYSDSVRGLLTAMPQVPGHAPRRFSHLKKLMAEIPKTLIGDCMTIYFGAGTQDSVQSNAGKLVRPLTKCLISLACAPELAGRWSHTAGETTWNVTRALLFDIAPYLQDHLATRSPSETAYVTILGFVSPRDLLLLLSSLIDMNPDFQEECDEEYMKTVMIYQSFQTLDIGCEQAAILALRVITNDHADNQRRLEKIKSELSPISSVQKKPS
eukprot:Gregarina_sp_Poly_1__3949@NODE_2189_length_2513_cov_23_084628_g1410_i0_p1_GENE_NODE_2189_length_2513_cov_23_084628_g1410_i0NODE_2189_length_2513_cov_23_084628_g1410_i0_p1_ORF_typecomplete_len826_score121_75Atx10homo_assoc/PF09759_9/7_9e03Atx10homo_assoc/PF09759_9/9_2e03Atx10homo_assoc/PF09759_9/0_033PAG/PF15347_6/0_028_NODE_2189_length_2513_cov_23_084628_g1410_i0252502